MPAKLVAVTAIALAFGSAASAEGASLEDVVACKLIEAPLERVACYDEAVGRLETATSEGDVILVSRAEVQKVERDSFGFSIPSLAAIAGLGGGEKDTPLSRVTEAVSSVSASGGSAKLRIVLENGQVWLQTDDKRVRVREPKSAEIYEAALGSYKMKLDDGLAFRVRRER